MGPTSMNYALRKKDNEKIIQENDKIARRLLERRSSVKLWNIDKEYKRQEYLKNQLSKVKLR